MTLGWLDGTAMMLHACNRGIIAKCSSSFGVFAFLRLRQKIAVIAIATCDNTNELLAIAILRLATIRMNCLQLRYCDCMQARFLSCCNVSSFWRSISPIHPRSFPSFHSTFHPAKRRRTCIVSLPSKSYIYISHNVGRNGRRSAARWSLWTCRRRR